jgi:hypothetical protein
MNPEESFHNWFVVPIRWLEAVPNNDGSFVALATALFLYERYAKIKLREREIKATDKNIAKQIVLDFGVDEQLAEVYWDVMRNGLLHQGIPKQSEQGEKKFPEWIFHHNKIDKPIELRKFQDRTLLFVQPWDVVNKIIALWQDNSELLSQNESFPWAQVFSLEPNTEKTNDKYYLVTGSSSGLGILSTK